MGRSVHPEAIGEAKDAAEEGTKDPAGGLPARLHTCLGALSPSAWTFAVTTVTAFLLFVGFDSYLALTGAQQRLELGARMLAYKLAEAPDADPAGLASELGEMLGEGSLVLVRDPTGRLKTVRPLGAAAPAATPDTLDVEHETAVGDWGSLTVQQTRSAILAPVFYRAMLGAALISLFVLVMVQTMQRRRKLANCAPNLKQLLEALPHGLACWAPDGRLLAANRPMRKLLGHARFATPDQHYTDALKALAASGDLRDASDGDGGRRFRLTLKRGEQLEIAEYELTGMGFITVVSNQTRLTATKNRLHEVEAELRRVIQKMREHKMRGDAASRSKIRFLAHLNHELRTPLNHIIGFADLIGHQSYGPVGDKRYLTYTQHIKQSGETLLAALSSMLELAEFNSGERPAHQEPVHLNELFSWCCERYTAQAKRAGVALDMVQCEDLVLQGDRHLFKRMIGIILDNALRYTPHGGRVSVTAWTASDGVVLEVTDTGVGIAPEQQVQLNQSFVLGENAFKLSGSGGGLGIPIARAIAELSGGEMVINSTPAIGTTVAVSLPLANMKSDTTRAA